MLQEVNALQVWDRRFIDLAQTISLWSKDPSRKIGAIAVSEKLIPLSFGWNGFPRGIKDDERLHNREIKYGLIVHAEANLIYNACHNGISLDHSTIYVYGLPVCSKCALGLVQVGVVRVISVVECFKAIPEIWMKEYDLTKQIFDEVGLIHSLVELR